VQDISCFVYLVMVILDGVGLHRNCKLIRRWPLLHVSWWFNFRDYTVLFPLESFYLRKC